MKIHYLVTSLEAGGAEFAIPRIVESIQRLGHQVSIIACEPRDMMAASHLGAAGLGYDIISEGRRSIAVMLCKYMKRIFQNRPDVIWTSLSWATRIGQLAGRLTGIPVISFKHSASVKPATERMKHMSQLWVADSITVERYLREEMQIPLERVMKWPLYRCNLAAPEASVWDGQSVLQVGSVGRLHKVKNYDLMIQAMASFLEQHPQYFSRIHLTILGDGPERENLDRLIEHLGLQETVSLPGFSNEVEEFLASLHIYVQPSCYEGMCLAAHEAMNAALPVIATPVGELKDSIKNGETGFTLDGDMTPAFCDIFERIFIDPSILHECGYRARAYVRERFGDEAYTKSAADILEKIERDIFSGVSKE